ncbi:MAG: hypothetical protein LBR09_00680 [Endomicrobium sp.]|jgi:hypothetical protein|nr:hypothetical protein [Endomicrobium sp.]
MPLYNVKKIKISSIVRIFPIIFTILGVIFGGLLFLGYSLNGFLTFKMRLLVFANLLFYYVISMTFLTVVAAWIYNFIVVNLNYNIVVSLEPADETTEEE